MRANLKQTINYILQDEGPEFNRGGSEPGGGSKYGISMTVLQEVKPGAILDDLGKLGLDDAGEIYATHILPTVRFDELPSGVDYRTADVRTNLGLTGCVNLLELVVGRWPLTGKFDDNLMIALIRTDQISLVHAISAAWIAKKHESPNWETSLITRTGYGHGWTNRNVRATSRALDIMQNPSADGPTTVAR